jgi:hypothetical protein
MPPSCHPLGRHRDRPVHHVRRTGIEPVALARLRSLRCNGRARRRKERSHRCPPAHHPSARSTPAPPPAPRSCPYGATPSTSTGKRRARRAQPVTPTRPPGQFARMTSRPPELTHSRTAASTRGSHPRDASPVVTATSTESSARPRRRQRRWIKKPDRRLHPPQCMPLILRIRHRVHARKRRSRTCPSASTIGLLPSTGGSCVSPFCGSGNPVNAVELTGRPPRPRQRHVHLPCTPPAGSRACAPCSYSPASPPPDAQSGSPPGHPGA